MPGALGALGGVLRQVRHDRPVGHLSISAQLQRSNVELLTPADPPARRPLVVPVGGEGRCRRSVYRVDQVAEDDAGRRDDPVAVGWIGSVEPEQCVQMHDAAPLELGDLGVREPDRGAVVSCDAGQLAAQTDDGPTPQLADVRVPHDLPGVVVAVQAERQPEDALVLVVIPGTAQVPPVRAWRRLPPGPARQHSAGARGAPAVHQPERRRGQGQEHRRVPGDLRRHTLPAAQARSDELPACPPGTAPSKAGTPTPAGPRTPYRSPRPAHRAAPSRRPQLARAQVGPQHRRAQSHRPHTPTGGLGAGEPGREVGSTGPANHLGDGVRVRPCV